MTGIISYGVYIPKYRIKPSQIALAWGKEVAEIEKSLGVFEKAVASYDEDAITLSIAAANQALVRSKIAPDLIGGITIGSESHPYAVKPSSTTVAEVLGMGTDYLAVDLEFACKAGTAGMQLLSSFTESKHAKYCLAIGSDVAQSKPSDVLEYTASSAACALILGKDNAIFWILLLFLQIPRIFGEKTRKNFPRTQADLPASLHILPIFWEHPSACSKELK